VNKNNHWLIKDQSGAVVATSRTKELAERQAQQLKKTYPKDTFKAEQRVTESVQSAAPDMLEALELLQKLMPQLMKGVPHIVVDFGLLNEALIKMDASVAKAKGDS
jgi:hypothetical protein